MTTEGSEDKFEIHAAAREGRIQTVESLLNSNPRLLTRRDDDGRVPLHWAVSYNHPEIVNLLLQPRRGLDADVSDELGWTPLMMACSQKEENMDIINALIRAGASVTTQTNNGQTALHFAVSKLNLAAAKRLLEEGASARTRDKRGQVPLHRASAVGSIPIIKLLLEHKSGLDPTDVDGLTPLHHAIAEGHGDAAVTLIKAGAVTDKKDNNDQLAINLAPDAKVRDYVLRAAEQEGVEVAGGEAVKEPYSEE